MTDNRHVVDRLADLRSQIRELEEEEKRLRAQVLERRHDLTGDLYEARIGSQDRRHLDLKALADEVGRSLLDRFTTTKRITVVRLQERSATTEETAA